MIVKGHDKKVIKNIKYKNMKKDSGFKLKSGNKPAPTKFFGGLIKGVLGGGRRSKGSAASRAKAAMFGRYNRPAGMALGTRQVSKAQLNNLVKRFPMGGALNAARNLTGLATRKSANRIGGAVSTLVGKGIGRILGKRR